MSSPRKSRIGKADQTGRTERKDDRHFRLYDWMWKSAAWSSLSPAERAVYVEIEMRFFGSNNGRIGLGVRAAADACNISKGTAAKCFSRLVDTGFIECATPGGFSRKDPHASEWRLTRTRCDVSGQSASKAFMHWRPTAENAERGTKIRTLRYQNEDSSEAKCA